MIQPWIPEMVARLKEAKNGEKEQVIASFRELTGRSRQTLYRIARGNGYDRPRKARSDRGTRRCQVTNDQLESVGAMIKVSAREVKGTILPMTEAVEIAKENGMIKTKVSTSRVQALMRGRQINPACLNAETPSIRMRSLHPNHVHVFDASICIQYYLKGKKGLQIIDERDFREKKPQNFGKIKERLIRMILTDHFTHYMFVRYYVAAGENQGITYDFLTSAWRGGLHEKIVFRGVPRILLMDAGSANIAKGILGLLKALDIQLPENMPHNPRRQGSAECAQNIWETHFEARLRFDPVSTIEEINRHAIDYMVGWNGTRIHRRHGMTRTSCWLKNIRQEHIRDLPAQEVIADMYAEPEVERTVRPDNTISFQAEDYRVKCIEGIRPGAKVMVIKRPYLFPEIAVAYKDKEYIVKPIPRVKGGFLATAAVIGEEYKSQPETMTQQAVKRMEHLAYGEERKKDQIPFGRTLQVFGHHAEKVGAVPMPRRGTAIETGRDIVSKEIPIMELFKRLREAGVVITTEMNAELREEFGGSIEVRIADEFVRAIAAGEDWRIATGRIATGRSLLQGDARDQGGRG